MLPGRRPNFWFGRSAMPLLNDGEGRKWCCRTGLNCGPPPYRRLPNVRDHVSYASRLTSTAAIAPMSRAPSLNSAASRSRILPIKQRSLTWRSARARYKGRRSPAVVERDFPNIVEMPVPPGGLGKRLDAMHDFHTGRNIQSHRGRGRHEEGRDFIRWCFADPIVAEVFAAEFGGKCIRSKRLQDLKAMRKKQIQNLTKPVLHPCCMEKIARYKKALKHADFIVMDEIGPDNPKRRPNKQWPPSRL